MEHQSIFTDTHHAAIDVLCRDITRRVQRTVVADYGHTDDEGTHDVALCVDSLPAGAWGTPGVLVSILTFPDVARSGYSVLAADGSLLADGVEFMEALGTAKLAAVRQYRKLSVGALKAA